MNSAIIINLDYERYGGACCKRIWDEIEQRMSHAGFVKHKRLFLTTLNREAACHQAKAVVAEVENVLTEEGILVFDVIREFYGFEYQQINDLLAPSSEPVEVSFVDTGTFRAYLGTGQKK